MALPDQARVWGFREASLGLSMAMKGTTKSLSFVEDTAVAARGAARLHRRVPRDDSPQRFVLRRLRACLGRLPARQAGREHEDRGGVARFEAIATQSADLVLKYGGALSGEHGDGLVRGTVHGEDVRLGALPGVPDRQAHVRPERRLQSGQDRRLLRR